VPDTALIVIDMLNAYDHEDAESLAASVKEKLPQIVELRNTAGERDDVMLVYVQDNHDAWNVERDDLVERACQGEHPELVEPIAPVGRVALLQKGRHSIFYQTALDHLLRVEDVERVILIGQVTEQCVLYSALDAYLRGYDVVVPPDAVAHIDADLAEAALAMMERNMHAELTPAGEVFSYSRSS
jgi:nicotinamidase-related amidase